MEVTKEQIEVAIREAVLSQCDGWDTPFLHEKGGHQVYAFIDKLSFSVGSKLGFDMEVQETSGFLGEDT